MNSSLLLRSNHSKSDINMKPELDVLYENLPEPYKVTVDDIKRHWNQLYEKLLVTHQNNDHRMVSFLLEDTVHFTDSTSFKMDKETYRKYVLLLYDIITQYPVKSILEQCSAAYFLGQLIIKNGKKEYDDLVLEWKPLYKFIKYVYCKSDDLNFGSPCYDLENVLMMVSGLSKFFPEGATEEIIRKFVPHISSRGLNNTVYLVCFAAFVPVKNGVYKSYIKYFNNELRDTSEETIINIIIYLYVRIFSKNMKDDFSEELPYVFNLIETYLLNSQQPPYFSYDSLPENSPFKDISNLLNKNLGICALQLMLCLSTRKEAIRRFKSTLESAISFCHPSNSAQNSLDLIISFTSNILLFLNKYMCILEKGDFETLPEEIYPSKEIIHQILAPIVDLCIMYIGIDLDRNHLTTIRNVNLILKYDYSFFDRFYSYAKECIQLTEYESIAQKGWTVMTVLVKEAANNPILQKDLVEIFRNAAESFRISELQNTLSKFFISFFGTIPFNKNNTIQGFNANFSELIEILINSLCESLRMTSSLNGKQMTNNPFLALFFVESFKVLLANSDQDVINKLIQIAYEMISDSQLCHARNLVSQLIYHLSYRLTDEQNSILLEKIKKLLKDTLVIEKTKYLLAIYGKCCSFHCKTIDDFKVHINFLKEFTESKSRKIKKIAWIAISDILKQQYNVNVSINDKTKLSTETTSIKNFEIKWDKIIDTSDYFLEIFNPFFDTLQYSNDQQEILDAIKTQGVAVLEYVENQIDMIEGSNKENTYALVDSIYHLPVLAKKSVPIKERLLDCTLRIIHDFPDSENIIVRILSLCNSVFSSLSTIGQKYTELIPLFITYLWGKLSKSSSNFNNCNLSLYLKFILYHRMHQIIIPVSPKIEKLFHLILPLGTSSYITIRNTISNLFSMTVYLYHPIFSEIIRNMINNISKYPVDEVLDFLNFPGILSILSTQLDLVCPVLLYLCNKLELKDQESIDQLRSLISSLSVTSYSFECPTDNQKDCVEFLENLEKLINQKSNYDRTFNYTAINAIIKALMSVYDVSEGIFKYVLLQMESYDKEIRELATILFTIIIKRRSNIIKHKRTSIHKLKITELPKIIGNSVLIPPQNPTFFKTDTYTLDEDENQNIETEDIEINEDVLLQLENEMGNIEIEEEEETSDSQIQLIFDSFEKSTIAWDKPDNLKENQSHSNGWYTFCDHYFDKEYEKLKSDVIIDSLPRIFHANMISINPDNTHGIIYKQFSYLLEDIIGPQIIPVLKKLYMKYLSEQLSEEQVSFLIDFIMGIMNSLYNWKTEDCINFFKSIILPFVSIGSCNPSLSLSYSDFSISLCTAYNPELFSPLINFMFDYASADSNSHVASHNLLSYFTSILFYRTYSFYTSLHSLYDRFVAPYLNKLGEMTSTLSDEIVCMVYILLESTVVPEDSPLYSPELLNERKFIINEFEKAISNFDTNKKSIIVVLTQILSFASTSNIACMKIIIDSLIDKVILLVLNALNAGKVSYEENLLETLLDFLTHPIFSFSSSLMYRIIKVIMGNIEQLAAPMQIKLLVGLYDMMSSNLQNVPASDFNLYYKIFLDYVKISKTEEVKIKTLNILGLVILRSENKYKEISYIEASAILLNSFIYDQIDELIFLAFETLSNVVENNPKHENISLFKKSIQQFWLRTTGHVLPSIEEKLTQCRNLFSPDYIS